MGEQPISEPKAVIASTGRSGSGYIAKVLQAYGINAGHEQYWRFPWQQPKEVEIDSSWLAVKHLSDFDGVVFHQVRNPLHVLTSLMNTYSKDTDYSRKYFPFREELMPQRTGDLQRDFMSMIVWMNEEIEKYAVRRWKLENIGVNVVCEVSQRTFHTHNPVKAKTALKAVSTSYNSHHDSKYLEWDDIADSKEKTDLRKQAERYGYR